MLHVERIPEENAPFTVGIIVPAVKENPGMTGNSRYLEGLKRNSIFQAVIKHGDRIAQFVVTKYEQDKPFKMVGLQGGLKITPWHPVFYNDKWQFPHDIGTSIELEVNYVYNYYSNR